MLKEEDKKITNEDIAELIESLAVSTNRGFEKIEQNMVTKKEFSKVQTDLTQVQTDLSQVQTDLTQVQTDLSQMQTDYKSFRTETVERFDKIDISIKEINENIEGIVADYHPHIVALEEKVFGFSTLAQ